MGHVCEEIGIPYTLATHTDPTLSCHSLPAEIHPPSLRAAECLETLTFWPILATHSDPTHLMGLWLTDANANGPMGFAS